MPVELDTGQASRDAASSTDPLVPAEMPSGSSSTHQGRLRQALLRVRPIHWVAAIAVISTALRAGAALRVRTPFFLPDEYLYTAMARSFAHTGVPRVRGSFMDFPWLLGPVLMAPAWLVHDVEVAYRLAQGLGAAWFSLAAFPAYLLARRVGISSRGAIVVALLSVLVPDGAFTLGLLTEPYAYPIFLLVVLVALDACVAPTLARQLTAVVLMTALCLVRAQFLPVWGAYVAAAFVGCGGSVRLCLRRQWFVLATIASAGMAVLMIGPGRFAGVYSGLGDFRYPAGSIARSLGINLFVLAIASGWVIVPGAGLGLVRLARDIAVRSRVYATLAAVLLASVLLEAACFAPNAGGHVLERYTFYVAPLVAIAFVWEIESRPPGLRAAIVSYSALAVVLLLGTTLDQAASQESPTLLGLAELPGATVHTPALIWAPILGGASVLTALLRRRPNVGLLLAAVIAASLSVVASKAFIDEADARFEAAPRIAVPSGSGLLTYPEAGESFLLETLFWAPQVSRVLVLGGSEAADGLPALPVELDASRGLLDHAHRPVGGPFAVGNDAVFVAGDTGSRAAPGVSAIARPPSAVVFGWYRADNELEYIGRLVATAHETPVVVSMRLRSLLGRRTLAFLCTDGQRRRDFVVGRRATWVRIAVQPNSTQSCRFSLIQGAPESVGFRFVSGIEADRLRVRAVRSG